MKKRHLVVGFSAVLVLALAVPALGGPLPLQLRASRSTTLLSKAKKTLKSAIAAHQLAEQALGTATRAQSISTDAVAAVGRAESTSSGALAGAKLVEVAAAGATTTAQRVAPLLGRKVTGVASVPGPNDGGTSVGGDNEKFQFVGCTGDDTLFNVGFQITENAAEPHRVEPIVGVAQVVAQSGGDPFRIRAFAMCLKH